MALFSGQMTSAAFAVDNKKTYSMSWSDRLVTSSGYGSIRLLCYVDSGVTPCTIPYLEFTLATGGVPASWVRYSVPVFPYNYSIGSGNVSLPSGMTFGKVQIYASGNTGVTTKRYIQGLDFCEGLVSPGYSPMTEDATWVIGDGITNGSINVGSPFMRTSYEHIGWRQWKSEDAAQIASKGMFLTFEDTDAVALEEYSYAIDAEDKSGNRSPLSIPQTIVAGDVYPPSQVSGLTISAGPLCAILSYTCPSDSDFSHTRIYSDVGLNTLIRTEMGEPGTNDTAGIDGLVGGQSYTFWVTTVDKYGNENRASVPSGVVVPLKSVGDEPLTVVVYPDSYVKAEAVQVKVFSWVNLTGFPDIWITDNATPSRHTIHSLNVASGSTAGTYPAVYTGTITVTSGSLTEGSGWILASGITSSGTAARSNLSPVVIDFTPPYWVSIFPVLQTYNYDNGAGKYFYKSLSPNIAYYVLDAVAGVDYITFAEDALAIEYPAASQGYCLYNSSNSNQGAHTVLCGIVDKAGNVASGSTHPLTFYVDTLGPIVEIVNEQSWINSANATITFSGQDNTRETTDVSGFKHVWYQYKIGNGAWSTPATTTNGVANPSITINNVTGTLYLSYKGVDNCGNESEYPIKTINVDNVAPSFSSSPWMAGVGIPGGYQLNWNPANIVDNPPSSGLESITLYRNTANDSATSSGIVTLPYSLSSKSYIDVDSSLKYYTTYYWWMKAKDKAGNESAFSAVYSGQIAHDLKGIFRNFVNNGSFERLDNAFVEPNIRPAGWYLAGAPTLSGSPFGGAYAAKVNDSNYYYLQNIQFPNHDLNRRWIMSFQGRYATSSASAIVEFVCYDANRNTTTVSYTGTLTNSYAQKSFTIGNSGDKTIPASTLSADIRIKSSNANYIYIDEVQLEQPASNATSTPSVFVDSYVMMAEILQGQRIIGGQIETGTLTTELFRVKPMYPNQIKNGSFEQGTSNWVMTNAVLFAAPYEGNWSARFNGVGNVESEFSFPVDINSSYCFSSYILGPNGEGYNFIISPFDKNNNALTVLTSGITYVGDGSSYNQSYAIFGSGTANAFPANTAKAKVKLAKTTTGQAYADCLQFSLGTTPPTSWNDGGITTIYGGNIQTESITATQLAAESITAAKIAVGSVTAEKMSVGTGDNAIKNSNFEIGQVTPTHLASHWALGGNATIYSGANVEYGSRCAALPDSSSYVSISEPTIYQYPYIDRTMPICFSVSIKSSAIGSVALQIIGYDHSNNATTGWIDVTTITTTTSWARYYGVYAANSLPAGTVRIGYAIQSRSNGLTSYVDLAQIEQSLTPSRWNTGATTTIVGDCVTTGKIKSANGNTEFDLDGATIKCVDASGNYSKLDSGQLVFYNATTTGVQNYAQNITYIPASKLIAGTPYVFSGNERQANVPYVVLQPMRIQTYVSGLAQSQFVGWDVDNISATGFTPHIYLYSGLSTTTINTYTPASGVTIGTDDATFESSYDAKNEQSPNTTTRVIVTVRGKNDSTSIGKTTLNGKLRLSTSQTWDGGAESTKSFTIVTIPNSTEWVENVITFAGFAPGYKCVKLDWVSGGSAANNSMELYQIQYVSEPQSTEITGSGLCGALVIGKSI